MNLQAWYEQLPPEKQRQAAPHIAQIRLALEQNPLVGFQPHPPNKDGRRPQLEFIEARTPIVAAFAGNRFGKSTVLGVCALRELLPRDWLPPLLRDTKRFDAPTQGWILCPTEDKIFDSFQPVFERWCPPAAFKGGAWGKAFNGARMSLEFSNGSRLFFKTYKQDPSTLGGAALHFVGYDEPPPKKHREECMFRLGDRGGYEMFAMTPLDTNTGYIRREVFKKRESPDVTVVSGSIHENPTLDKATVARALGSVSDIYRVAREFGIFVNVGGLIYPDFERCVLKPGHRLVVKRGEEHLIDPEFVRSIDDHVVGIDPGIRNAGFSFSGFDQENVKWTWQDGKLQDATPRQYAEFIRGTLGRWGVQEEKVHFVSDPAARQRGQTNAETVMSALALEEIYCNAGQNDVEAGIGQMRIRMQHGRYWVGPNCRFLRDEADDYAAEEPDEGKDDSHLVPIKGNDHVLDADRYSCMERFWDPIMEQDAPQRNLGWDPTRALPGHELQGMAPRDSHPLGAMF